MSTNDPSDVDQLLPDFVAECDEHLTAAHRTLLEVESSPGQIDPQQIGSLFRNFHTVKGLSGMVGLAEAERLAHEMEAYWGVVRKGQAAPTESGIGLLSEGVRALEGIVAARRDGIRIPDVDALVARLAALIHAPFRWLLSSILRPRLRFHPGQLRRSNRSRRGPKAGCRHLACAVYPSCAIILAAPKGDDYELRIV